MIDLTQFTDAGGCGCKISPDKLKEILDGVRASSKWRNLLVGNFHNDDAAVYRLTSKKSLVFTDDFFTPVIDDPYLFGKIASANAVSDIFAMGGKPIVALSILGWPVDVIPLQYAKEVMAGAKSICDQLNIAIAGGHSINNPQPLFGLSVLGIANPKFVKQNSAAKQNDLLYLTKPIGSGIYSTALKRKLITSADKDEMVSVMCTLNSIGRKIAKLDFVHAMTDITGFGLLGHVNEICSASGLAADIFFDKIRLLKHLHHYFDQGIITSGGSRNWENLQSITEETNAFKKVVLSDPQTNGGLLVTVDPAFQSGFETFLMRHDLIDHTAPIGILKPKPNNLCRTINVL